MINFTPKNYALRKPGFAMNTELEKSSKPLGKKLGETAQNVIATTTALSVTPVVQAAIFVPSKALHCIGVQNNFIEGLATDPWGSPQAYVEIPKEGIAQIREVWND